MSDLWPSLLLSLRIALTATALTLAIGVPLALFMARRRFLGKTLLETLFLLPLVMPPTVMGYFILVACGRGNGFGRFLEDRLGIHIIMDIKGAILAAAVVAFPLMYIPVKAAFVSIPRELAETARLMGANWLQTFWHVSVPLARRGLASGMILAFARSIGEFGATMMVFGLWPRRQTLPISIWNDYTSFNMMHALPTVIVLTLISLAVMIFYNLSSSGKID